MKTLRVTGNGNIKVRPDMTRITVTVVGTLPEYEAALKKSAEDTELLRKLLTGLGFEGTDLKTLSFDVDPEYEEYREKDVFKNRLIGYTWRHVAKVEFDSDNDRLGKILYALAKCSVKPELRISYTVKDQESVKNELLGKAVTDAREKALVLSKAADLTLGAIQSIDYSWGRIDFETSPMNRSISVDSMVMKSAGPFHMDIEPDDIEVSDTVTVVWEIG